ncbi:MAG: XdhC family protein [Fimbriimonadaceae bacterium]|nr:XdhC family protein [Fimbriimonadaceae bacterium]
MSLDWLEAAASWSETGRQVALAILVDVAGSSPRSVGAVMAVRDDGLMIGSISGGCVEGEVVRACLEALRTGQATFLEFGPSELNNPWSAGLTCGGAIRVWATPWPWQELPPALLAQVRAAHSQRTPVPLATCGPPRSDATRLTSPPTPLLRHQGIREPNPPGAGEGSSEPLATCGPPRSDATRLTSPPTPLLRHQGIREPNPPGAGEGSSEPLATCRPPRSDATRLTSPSTPLLRHEDLREPSPSGAGEGSSEPLWLNPPLRLVIVGAVHITATLVGLATAMGYETVVIDPRCSFAVLDRFAVAPTSLIPDWPQVVLPKMIIDARTCCLALTHDPKIDDPALIHFLGTEARFVGALGGRKSRAEREVRFAQAGLDAQQIARLRQPVGLDIGSRGPEEIAAGILAEIVQVL